MSIHRLQRAALATLALATACESGTDPEPTRLVDLVLDFCSNDVPVWFAYRNEGAAWVRVVPDASGSVSFTASNDVALAFVHQDGADYATEIIYAANHELEAISGRTCREEQGGKTVNGTVAGVVGSQQLAQVGMSYSSAYLQHTQSSFSLTNLPERPLDLIASRTLVLGSNQQVDRLILRRNQSPLPNATMPVLDFNAAEARSPTTFGITVSGVAAGDLSFLMNAFVSQLETRHVMTYIEPAGNAQHTVVGVPQQDLAAGDYHDAFVIASDGTGATRGAERYFLAPTNQTLTLGAVMGIPTVSEVATTPYLRVRAQLTRGADYALAMRAEFLQERSSFSTTRVVVTLTRGYQESGNWEADIPDFTGVTGWQHSWGLVNGGEPIEWTILAYGGRPDLLVGAAPRDGEGVRFASRTNTMNASVSGAFRARATARLPRPFGPFR